MDHSMDVALSYIYVSLGGASVLAAAGVVGSFRRIRAQEAAALRQMAIDRQRALEEGRKKGTQAVQYYRAHAMRQSYAPPYAGTGGPSGGAGGDGHAGAAATTAANGGINAADSAAEALAPGALSAPLPPTASLGSPRRGRTSSAKAVSTARQMQARMSRLDSPSIKLIVWLAFACCLFTLRYVLVGAIRLASPALLRAVTQKGTASCVALGLWGQFWGTAFVGWGGAVALNALLMARNPFRYRAQRATPALHATVWGVSLAATLVVAVAGDYAPANDLTCFVAGDEPRSAFGVAFSAPMLLCVVVATTAAAQIAAAACCGRRCQCCGGRDAGAESGEADGDDLTPVSASASLFGHAGVASADALYQLLSPAAAADVVNVRRATMVALAQFSAVCALAWAPHCASVVLALATGERPGWVVAAVAAGLCAAGVLVGLTWAWLLRARAAEEQNRRGARLSRRKRARQLWSGQWFRADAVNAHVPAAKVGAGRAIGESSESSLGSGAGGGAQPPASAPVPYSASPAPGGAGPLEGEGAAVLDPLTDREEAALRQGLLDAAGPAAVGSLDDAGYGGPPVDVMDSDGAITFAGAPKAIAVATGVVAVRTADMFSSSGSGGSAASADAAVAAAAAGTPPRHRGSGGAAHTSAPGGDGAAAGGAPSGTSGGASASAGAAVPRHSPLVPMETDSWGASSDARRETSMRSLNRGSSGSGYFGSVEGRSVLTDDTGMSAGWANLGDGAGLSGGSSSAARARGATDGSTRSSELSAVGSTVGTSFDEGDALL